MTIKVKKFGPERLLSAPRRGPAVPSPDGKYALYTCSTYSFESHSKSSDICLLDIENKTSSVISTDAKASEPQWLGENGEVVWLKSCDNGNTSLVIASARGGLSKTYVAGTIPGPVSALKLYYIKPGMVAVAVAGTANPDGSLYNSQHASKPHSSARLYDANFARHWDTWITPQRNSIFTALLQRAGSKVAGSTGRFNLIGFNNALKGTGLECPIPTFGGTDHFDIGREGLLVVSKDPDLDPSTHTKCNAYFIPRKDLMDMSVVEPRKLTVPGFEGAATSPVFSCDGESGAFLQMKEDGYESDKNHIVFVHGLGSESISTKALTQDGFDWDRSPSSILWSNDGKTLYLQAENIGLGALWDLDLTEETAYPRQLTSEGTVVDVARLSSTSPDLFISSNSLVDSSLYSILHLDPSAPPKFETISSATNHGGLFGLSSKQVHSLWWTGDQNYDIHAWMMVPSNFDRTQKYPLAYLVHGGPQGAWLDSWSTRWNPAIFAEQGYVVVLPNPTGSTSYGQPFTDRIKSNWGGSPYTDLANGFTHIERHCPYIDTTRAVALGASYGGYMMNWIQGHPLGRKFTSLVCHDGVFSMTAQLASDEQYFPLHDLGGPLWTRQHVYDQWDPARHLSSWATPMLVIHSELDYRLTVAEGLAAFNVLQTRGVKSRFLSFPDENHWVLNPENSLVWHLVVLNWINGFVGLGTVVDSHGRDGDQYLMQAVRRGGSGGGGGSGVNGGRGIVIRDGRVGSVREL